MLISDARSRADAIRDLNLFIAMTDVLALTKSAET